MGPEDQLRAFLAQFNPVAFILALMAAVLAGLIVEPLRRWARRHPGRAVAIPIMFAALLAAVSWRFQPVQMMPPSPSTDPGISAVSPHPTSALASAAPGGDSPGL